MTQAAPISRAPSGGAQADRSLRQHHDGVAERTPPDSAPLNPVEAMSATAHLLVAELIRDAGEVRLRVRHEDVLRLRAVDGVAEAPAAERRVTGAVPAL
jgi:hypothetical protein